jgi:hypothetical protein
MIKKKEWRFSNCRKKNLGRSSSFSCRRRTGKCSAEARECFHEHFHVHAHPDAKVVGHFEEAAGDG